jgi:hypothetical protein
MRNRRLRTSCRSGRRAHSPGEFWRRWNTYVGGWAQAYVFVPLASALRRSSERPGTTRMAYAVAVVVTFAVIGLLHDVFVVTDDRRWSGRATTWFFLMGCLVAIWELVVRRKARHGAAGRGGRGIVERTVFLLAACFAAATGDEAPQFGVQLDARGLSHRTSRAMKWFGHHQWVLWLVESSHVTPTVPPRAEAAYC